MYTRARILKSLKAKVLTTFASFALLLGVGAAVTTVAAQQQNEVVETKAAADTTIYVTNNYSLTNVRCHYWGSKDATVSMASVYENSDGQQVLTAVLPSGTTGWQFVGWYSAWGRDTYSEDLSVPSNNTTGWYIVNTSAESGSKFHTAQWTVTQYTVKYDSNGGTGSVADGTAYVNGKYHAATNSFTRSGYTFQKWCASPIGDSEIWLNEDEVHIRTEATSDPLTLYAIWIPNTMRFVWQKQGSNNYIYLWDDTHSNAGWPGVATANSFSANGTDFYYYDFVYSTNRWIPSKVIFNIGSDSGKTGDLDVPVSSWDGEYYFALSDVTTYTGMVQSIYSVTKSNTDGTVTVAAYGTHGSSLSISWAPGSNEAYNYSFTSTKVYAGTDNTGALLATFTTGTSGTYTMTGKFLPQIFVETIYSKTIKQYEVRFNANGHGTAPDPQNVNHGGKVAEPSPAPSATGYAFGGWYKEAECTNVWNFSTDTVTAARALYAKWTANGFSVQYLPNGGTGSMGNSSLTYDSAGTISANGFTRTGYTFVGWTLIADGDVFCTSGEITKAKVNDLYPGSAGGTRNLYAKWTINSYNVTFNLQGHGAAIDPQTVDYGGKVSKPSDPSATGYTFGGWYKEAGCENAWDFSTDTVSGPTDLYAKWTINSYNVTFNLQGHGSSIAPQSIDHGNKVSKPSDPSADGYTFGGWYKEEGCENAWNFSTDTVTGNTVLYAKWTANVYTITLDNQGADSVGTTAIYEQYGVGIYRDAELTDEMTTGANPIVRPAKEGYTFAGYFTSGGMELIDANGYITSDLGNKRFLANVTLYAHWTANSYAVTITAGTGISSVYLSTTINATSGSPSGTSFGFNTTVYGFAVLAAGYAHQDTWEKVSGTDDTAGAIYRIRSLTVATSGNDFGTIAPISGETAAITYATNFNTAIGGVCKENNTTDTDALASSWATQKTNYAALADYVKYWLGKTTHSGDTNVTNMLAKYDYVCGKYGTSGLNLLGEEPDFLSRNPSVPASPALIPGAPKGNESPLTITLWIVLGAGMLGLGAIGTAYFVSKKKKRTQVR